MSKTSDSNTSAVPLKDRHVMIASVAVSLSTGFGADDYLVIDRRPRPIDGVPAGAFLTDLCACLEQLK